MAITAKELAKKLNLSATAVSMALNNKPGVNTGFRSQKNDSGAVGNPQILNPFLEIVPIFINLNKLKLISLVPAFLLNSVCQL